MKKILLLSSLLLLSTQPRAEDVMSKLQSLMQIEPSVEVNLGAAMLGLLSGMTSEEEQISEVMKNEDVPS